MTANRKASAIWFAGTALIFSIATLLCVYLLNLVVLEVGPRHYREVVERAAADGSFVDRLPMPLAHQPARYAHEVNDCLSLAILVVPRRDPRPLQPISPLVPDRSTLLVPEDQLVAQGYPPPGHCSDLYRFLKNPQDVPYSAYYHRYLHGSTTYIGLLLAFLSIKAARLLSLIAAYALLGFLALAALLRLRTRRRAGHPSARDLGFLIVGLDLILFGGIYPYAWSLTLAAAYCVLGAFLLLAYFRPPELMPERVFVAVALAFGCLTIFLELNTGEILMGLTAILVSLAIAETVEAKLLLRRALLGAGAFCLAVVLCLGLKMLLVAAVWGRREIGVFSSALVLRMGSGDLLGSLTPKELRLFSMIHMDPRLLERSRAVAGAYACFKCVYSAWSLYYGSVALAALATASGWIGALWLNLRLMRSGSPAPTRAASGLLLAALMLTPAWYLIFPNATILHASYFSRPLGWLPAILLVGILLRRKGRDRALTPRADAVGRL